jgi:hypothetical protein
VVVGVVEANVVEPPNAALNSLSSIQSSADTISDATIGSPFSAVACVLDQHNRQRRM